MCRLSAAIATMSLHCPGFPDRRTSSSDQSSRRSILVVSILIWKVTENSHRMQLAEDQCCVCPKRFLSLCKSVVEQDQRCATLHFFLSLFFFCENCISFLIQRCVVLLHYLMKKHKTFMIRKLSIQLKKFLHNYGQIVQAPQGESELYICICI
jgi:hypothetical protein